MEIAEEYLEHFGTKGMKWGVRREQKRNAKADMKWKNNIYSIKGAIAVHNKSADTFNREIGALNKRHPNSHLDYPDRPATKAYLRDVNKLMERATKDAVDSVHGISPSGSLRARVDFSDPNQAKIVVDSTEAKHADDTLPTLTFSIEIKDGQIVSTKSVDDDLEQTALRGEEFVEHFGTKGMKWGVRKEAFQKNRALNKASRQKEGNKHARTVDSARVRVSSGVSRQRLDEAKANYSRNKEQLGSREAKKILYKAHDKYRADIETSRQARDGKELAVQLLIGGVGSILLANRNS